MKIEPKGEKREPKAAKMKPKATKREPKETKRVTKGNQGEPKGYQKEAKGSQRRAKGSQRRAKGRQKWIKYRCAKKDTKKGGPASIFWLIFDPFWWAKNLEKYWKTNTFLAFQWFLEKLKKQQQFLELILDPFSISGAPKTPLFARLLSQGTCRYTYPMR